MITVESVSMVSTYLVHWVCSLQDWLISLLQVLANNFTSIIPSEAIEITWFVVSDSSFYDYHDYLKYVWLLGNSELGALFQISSSAAWRIESVANVIEILLSRYVFSRIVAPFFIIERKAHYSIKFFHVNIIWNTFWLFLKSSHVEPKHDFIFFIQYQLELILKISRYNDVANAQ